MSYLQPKFCHMTLFWPIRGRMGLVSCSWISIYVKDPGNILTWVGRAGQQTPSSPKALTPGFYQWNSRLVLVTVQGFSEDLLGSWKLKHFSYKLELPGTCSLRGHVRLMVCLVLFCQANRWTSWFASAKRLGSTIETVTLTGGLHWYVLYVWLMLCLDCVYI